VPDRERTQRDELAEMLAEAFPPEQLRVNQDKGNITYVPIAEVVARMNRIVGVGRWSTTIVDRWQEGRIDTGRGPMPAWVMVHVRMRVLLDGEWWESDGVGGQGVKIKTTQADAVDLGDEWKGAVSDAKKKALMDLGVALDLARKEEALDFERRQVGGLATKTQIDEMAAILHRIAERSTEAADEQKVRLRGAYGTIDLMSVDDMNTELLTLKNLYQRLLTGGTGAPTGPQPPARQDDLLDTSTIPAPDKAVRTILEALQMVSPEEAEMFEGWFLGHFQRAFDGGGGLMLDEAEDAMEYLGLTTEVDGA
jgi:hypothetical protein